MHYPANGACSCGSDHADRPRDIAKHPATAKGSHDASSDLEFIENWWLDRDWNIGMRCGAGSGVFAIDVDGPEGVAELAAIEADHGALPATFTTRSGRDDVSGHRVFAIPAGSVVRNRQLADHVDTRGENGYVILPPSVHRSGRRYEIVDDRDPVDAPAWLLDLLEPAEAVPVTAMPTANIDLATVPARVRAIFDARPVEDRSRQMFRLAAACVDAGLDDSDTLGVIAAHQPSRDKYGGRLDSEASRAIGKLRAARAPEPTAEGAAENDAARQQSQATKLVQLALARGTELWHDADDVGFATITVGEHSEHWPVRSRKFRTWAHRLYYEEEGSAPNAAAAADALAVLEGKAVFGGDEYPTFVRVATHDDAVYIDLCDDEWRCVEVTRAGWRVRDDAPVRFKRRRGMLPLPAPARGGELSELRPFVNIDDKEWPLLLAWLVGALHPRGPYPVLDIAAEHGNGKTFTARALRRIIDPNDADVRSAPQSTRDLAIAASNSWVCAFDNLSSLRVGLSDDLARLSTGAGFSTRALYENDEEAIFSACRPVVVNGIEDVVTRPDLLDRALLLRPPRIEKKDRRDETTMWAEYEAARSRVLGALLDAVVCALAGVGSVQLDGVPRMADFTRWVVAAEPMLGIDEGTFLQAYEANRAQGHELALEADAVAQAIVTTVGAGSWTGTARELAEKLKPDQPPKGWPLTGQAMAGAVKRAAPVLRAHGLTVDYNADARPRTWKLVGPPDDDDPDDNPPDDHPPVSLGTPRSGDASDASDATPSDQGKRRVTRVVTPPGAPDGSDAAGDRVTRPVTPPVTSDAPERASDLHSDTRVTSVTCSGDSQQDAPEPESARDHESDESDEPDTAAEELLTRELGARVVVDGAVSGWTARAGPDVDHPARYSRELLPVIARLLADWRLPVHDPFAGTGERLGRLCDKHGLIFTGTEIEPEFIVDARVREGDSTEAGAYPTGTYVIATSPTYPNGMADHFKAKEWKKRNTYRQALQRTRGGADRPLHPNNSGRYGVRYRTDRQYWTIVRKAVAHWPDHAVVNVKDFFYENTKVYPLVDKWIALLEEYGYAVVAREDVKTPGQRHGANRQRVETEAVLVVMRPA